MDFRSKNWVQATQTLHICYMLVLASVFRILTALKRPIDGLSKYKKRFLVCRGVSDFWREVKITRLFTRELNKISVNLTSQGPRILPGDIKSLSILGTMCSEELNSPTNVIKPDFTRDKHGFCALSTF